jgi:hypothetical protein
LKVKFTERQRQRQLEEADKEPDLEIRNLKRHGVKVDVSDSMQDFDWTSISDY